MNIRTVALVLLSFLPPAFPWNATGHRVVASIAYDHLTPAAKRRVDMLLTLHPDYAVLLTRDAPADPVARARAAFLAASVWADEIKSDNRYYDDTRANARPTPLLPGFSDMARHTNWHYIDVPFSPDGTPLVQPAPPNALTELNRILKELAHPASDQMAAYDIPWLIHIEGDVHQPLHCTGRFVSSQPKGDAGGNNVFVTPGRNLHFIWDDAAGMDASNEYVNRFAAGITAEFVHQRGEHPRLSRQPKVWIREGFLLAQREVYTFGPETGSREHPIPLSERYVENTRQVARTQLAVAGFRLAGILNEKFR